MNRAEPEFALAKAMLTRRDILVGSMAVGVILRTRTGLAKAAQPTTPVNFAVPAGACDFDIVSILPRAGWMLNAKYRDTQARVAGQSDSVGESGVGTRGVAGAAVGGGDGQAPRNICCQRISSSAGK